MAASSPCECAHGHIMPRAPDLRLLNRLDLEKVLLKQGIPYERIQRLNRWERARLVDDEKYEKEHLMGLLGDHVAKVDRLEKLVAVLTEDLAEARKALEELDAEIAAMPPNTKKRKVSE